MGWFHHMSRRRSVNILGEARVANLRHGIVRQIDKELGETSLCGRIVTKDG